MRMSRASRTATSDTTTRPAVTAPFVPPRTTNPSARAPPRRPVGPTPPKPSFSERSSPTGASASSSCWRIGWNSGFCKSSGVRQTAPITATANPNNTASATSTIMVMPARRAGASNWSGDSGGPCRGVAAVGALRLRVLRGWAGLAQGGVPVVGASSSAGSSSGTSASSEQSAAPHQRPGTRPPLRLQPRPSRPAEWSASAGPAWRRRRRTSAAPAPSSRPRGR